MKLRFKIDQAEALRQGVDAPTSVVTIEINPKKLTQEQRTLLADRMDGIDLRKLWRLSPMGSLLHRQQNQADEIMQTGEHIVASAATFEPLMAAFRANEEEVRPASQPEVNVLGQEGQ